jgi:tRNA threonylcarbamoyladenosine biosynthesis protein TsaB
VTLDYSPLLCLDTSTPVGSLALYSRSGLVASSTQESPRMHTERLFSTAESLLAGCGLTLAELGGVAVAAGPGSFTGLRIAASAAKTLAWVLEKPLFAVGSLKALSFGAAAWRLPVCAAFDAGQEEFYAACYYWGEPGSKAEELFRPVALSAEKLCIALADISAGRQLICLGPGFRKLREKILSALGSLVKQVPERFDLPDAALLGELALNDPEEYRVKDILTFEPFYVRLGQAELRLKS